MVIPPDRIPFLVKKRHQISSRQNSQSTGKRGSEKTIIFSNKRKEEEGKKVYCGSSDKNIHAGKQRLGECGQKKQEGKAEEQEDICANKYLGPALVNFFFQPVGKGNDQTPEQKRSQEKTIVLGNIKQLLAPPAERRHQHRVEKSKNAQDVKGEADNIPADIFASGVFLVGKERTKKQRR